MLLLCTSSRNLSLLLLLICCWQRKHSESSEIKLKIILLLWEEYLRSVFGSVGCCEALSHLVPVSLWVEMAEQWCSLIANYAAALDGSIRWRFPLPHSLCRCFSSSFPLFLLSAFCSVLSTNVSIILGFSQYGMCINIFFFFLSF